MGVNNIVKLEIERRFLLDNLPNNVGDGILTEQVYLPFINLKIKEALLFYEDKKITKLNEKKELQEAFNSNQKNYACRIRKQNNIYIFTVKIREAPGIRKEWEWVVGKEFEDFFNYKSPRISKVRYNLEFEGNIWEIDEFLDNNSGLIIAEIELKSLETELNLPTWVGEEITGEIKYLNSELAKQ